MVDVNRLADLFDPPVTGVLRYHDDPAGFVRDCVRWKPGEGPAPYQIKALEALVEHERVAMRSPRSAGKTATLALSILWFALTREAAREDWICVVTASVFRQLKAFLWGQLSMKWVPMLDWEKIGREPFLPKKELMLEELRLAHGSVILAATTDPAKMEGAHADQVYFIFDEAKNIADSIFDSVEGTFLGAGKDTRATAYIMVASTPGAPEGRFHDLCMKVKGFTSYESIRITLEESLACGQLSTEKVKEFAERYGEESAMYYNHVLGEFASQNVDAVISEKYLEMAFLRHDELELPPGDGSLIVPTHESLGPLEVIGVDVAGKGEDHSTYALRHGHVISRVYVRPLQPDTTILEGEIERLARFPELGARLVIDATGNGEPIANTLRARGCGVVPFVAALKSDLRTGGGQMGFDRVRSAAWWNLREMLEPGSKWELAIPRDEQIKADLLAPRYSEASGGNVAVEKKESIKKRLGRSTDAGDAIVQAYFLSRIAPKVSAPRILRRPGGSRNAPLRQLAGGGRFR